MIMSLSTDNMTKAVQSVATRSWHTFFPQAAVAQTDDLCKLKDTVAPGVEIFVPRGHKVQNLRSPMLEVAIEGRRYFAVFKRFAVEIKDLSGPHFNETTFAENLLKALQIKIEATGVTPHSCVWFLERPYTSVVEGSGRSLLDAVASVGVAAFDLIPMTKWEKRRAAVRYWFRGLLHA